MPSPVATTKPTMRRRALGGGGSALRCTAMNRTSAAIEIPTTIFTVVSGSLTAISAPTAEVTTVMIPSGTSRRPRTRPARANRSVAEMVMNVTANMFVATAWRGDIPMVFISGTLISEFPPVMAPIAPVTSIITVRRTICPVVIVSVGFLGLVWRGAGTVEHGGPMAAPFQRRPPALRFWDGREDICRRLPVRPRSLRGEGRPGQARHQLQLLDVRPLGNVADVHPRRPLPTAVGRRRAHRLPVQLAPDPPQVLQHLRYQVDRAWIRERQ